MARRAEDVGIAKAGLSAASTFALAILAGAFIAMGAVFATTTSAGSAELAFGVARLLAGITFSLGLILVVVAGAELFTGNNLVVMAWASRRVTTVALLRNWAIVYVGNFVGAIATVALMLGAKQYTFGGGSVGQAALEIAVAKTNLGFGQAVALGILCNGLVGIAVWLTYSARSTVDRILAVMLPIAAFVASGFEHSVANMYFIPFGLFVKGDASFVAGLDPSLDLSGLTWSAFFVDNLIPVTLGNIIGGFVLGPLALYLTYRPQHAALPKVASLKAPVAE
jgi:formate transporter